MMHLEQIDHVALRCASPEATKAWYVNILGSFRPLNADGEAAARRSYRSGAVPCAGFLLEIITYHIPKIDRDPTPAPEILQSPA